MVATTLEYGSAIQVIPSAAAPTKRAALSRLEAAHDAELVARFRSGDEDAFVEIVARYRDRMFSIALCHLRNHSDAEEIAQDTFIRAHRGLARFRGESSLATWLHRIAFNLSRNRHKHNFSRRRHAMLSLDSAFSDENQESIADLIASESPSPAREATVTEFADTVRSCMEKLGYRQREILMLRNNLSQSYGDIGRALGINIGTVKSRIGRARENLRTLLEEAYPETKTEAPGFSWFGPVRSLGRVAAASV
jgi:RNA polymerase sigma-70 factor (ECF subfamily)